MATTNDLEINTTNCNKGVWLVKLPKVVDDVLAQVQSGQELGYVSHNKVTGEVYIYYLGCLSLCLLIKYV